MDASSRQGFYSAGIAELRRIAAYLKDESIPLPGALAHTTVAMPARRHRYTLVATYVIAPDTAPLVTAANVLEMVHVARAGAVIVPGMAHLGGSVPAEFTRVCSVIMPGHVMLGRSLYPTPTVPGGAEDAEVQG